MKKFLGILTVCILFSGCAMMPENPEVSPILTMDTKVTATPEATGTIVFDIEQVKENDKLGDFTVKEVTRKDNKVESVKAEGKITLEGIFCRGDKVKDFDHTIYSDGNDKVTDFAVFKFQRSANDTMPVDEMLINLDELILVVKLKDATFNSDYGRAKIDITNINYTSKAKEYKYYTLDAPIHSQEAAAEHEFARQ